ncbi:hypothetical protein KQX54_000383 [Cotesia glomerata]|uniref:Uncharacterized protein n=1 Tax=Cotesia glomerata TaxID=32391 RepID=A0AAV7IRU6_COTGL|nr:hypothetical protein KQX54_000383 [Cotesia glomerata]
MTLNSIIQNGPKRVQRLDELRHKIESVMRKENERQRESTTSDVEKISKEVKTQREAAATPRTSALSRLGAVGA